MTRGWVFVAAGLSALAVMSTAVAQDARGAIGTAPPDAPPTPPTPQEAQTARTLTLARQVYALIGDQALEGGLRTTSTTLDVQIAQAMTDKDRARARAIVDAVKDSVADLKPQIASTAIQAMARDFTPQELQDMLAFYRSQSGRAALRKLPAITRQSLSVTLDALPDLMAAVETSFCAKVRCTARDHQAFAAATERLAAARPRTRPAS